MKEYLRRLNDDEDRDLRFQRGQGIIVPFEQSS